MNTEPIEILRRPEVSLRTGLPTTTIYDSMDEGTFPRPVRVTRRCVGWPSNEVDAWVRARLRGVDDAGIRLLVEEMAARRGSEVAA
jgi:prophage regulatory protein